MVSYPADRSGVILPLKIAVGLTSCLSIIGGMLIVLTFCWRVCQVCSRPCMPRAGRQTAMLLSPGRLILVNLSIADVLVAASHLWGVIAGYQTFFKDDSSGVGRTDTQCDVQGALAVYSTIASFLWTVILSFFVVGTLVLPHPRRYGSFGAFLIYILLCWGVPAVVLIVVGVRHEFGLDYDVTIAWCYILPKSKHQTQNFFISLIAYNLWNYLSIVLLLTFFFVTLCYTCCSVPRHQPHPQPGPQTQAEVTETTPLVNQRIARGNSGPQQETKSDYVKLIFAALILVVLRMWDAIYISLSYNSHFYDEHVKQSLWIIVLLFLAGIGNSGQGFANAILFLLCTKSYRNWIFQNFGSCCRRQTNAELH